MEYRALGKWKLISRVGMTMMASNFDELLHGNVILKTCEDVGYETQRNIFWTFLQSQD